MIWFFLIAALIVAALAGLHWRWRRGIEEEIREGAAIEWAALQKNEPEFLKGYDEQRFASIYRKVHFPRFPGYALATLATFFAALPISFSILTGSYWLGERLGWIATPAALAKYIPFSGRRLELSTEYREALALELAADYSGFYYFFGVLLTWVLVVAFFMRRYHSRRPGYLRDEIIRAR